MQEITTHLAIEHEAEPDSSSPELARIPQVDGILDELDVIPSPNQVSSESSMNNPGASSVPTASFSVLHVPYQLNQHKQITKLARDSTIDNIEITVNDNDRNVNIVCSTGFYEAVAKPALSSMSTSYSHSVLGVSILCTVFRKTQDQNMSQPGLFMRFELSGPDVEPNPVPLSVHLHNTQRKVQLQGGGLMPDKSRAPVWFLENILKNIFTDQAKRKKINIDQINRKILSEIAKLRLPPTQSTCSHCKKKFNAVSKPTTCHKCSLLKHSTKCSPCPMLSSPSTTRALAMQSVAIPMSTIPAPSSVEAEVSLTSTVAPPSYSTSTLTTPLLTLSHGQAIGYRSEDIRPPDTPTADTPDPVRVVTEPQPPIQLNNPVNNHHPTRRPRKTKEPVLALSKEDAEISFLKQELHSSQARITMLDTEIDDLNKTIKIQRARLKIFEDANNANASVASKVDKHTREGSCVPPPPPYTPCCYSPPRCSCRCSCSAQPRPPSAPDIPLSQDILEQISGLASEIETIKHILNVQKPPPTASYGPIVPDSPTLITTDDSVPMVVEADIHEAPAENSINSIEEFLPSNDDTAHLNFNPLTIQLE